MDCSFRDKRCGEQREQLNQFQAMIVLQAAGLPSALHAILSRCILSWVCNFYFSELFAAVSRHLAGLSVRTLLLALWKRQVSQSSRVTGARTTMDSVLTEFLSGVSDATPVDQPWGVQLETIDSGCLAELSFTCLIRCACSSHSIKDGLKLSLP